VIDAALVARARGAAEVLAPLAARIEAERGLPPLAVEALIGAGAFQLVVPRVDGGHEAHPCTMITVLETLARADGSAGWCAMVGATTGLLSAHLDAATAREVFGAADTTACGVFAPMGRATPEGEGYRVSGRWPFASGCRHARWLMGGAMVAGEMRCVIFRAEDVHIHDTWDTAGLRGTGSHDFEVVDVLVPRARTLSLFGAPPRVDRGLLFFGVLAAGVAAVGLGIARAALDAVTAMAIAKTPPGSKRTLAHRETLQLELARAEGRLGAARAGLLAAAAEATGELPARARLRIAASHAAEESAAIATLAFRAGGGSAVYAKNPLQRHLRDAEVAAQHLMVSASATQLAGRVLLGVESDTAML
jgi:alkylation response protein AidB-like acyl-CoA dehydrogenase